MNGNTQQNREPLPADKTLNCIDCRQDFIFTGKDQLFFKKMGFSDPKRCLKDRRAKRAADNNRGHNGR